MFSNPVKYSVSTVSNTIGRGNMYLDIDGYAYGDTPTTDWWMGQLTYQVDGLTLQPIHLLHRRQVIGKLPPPMTYTEILKRLC